MVGIVVNPQAFQPQPIRFIPEQGKVAGLGSLTTNLLEAMVEQCPRQVREPVLFSQSAFQCVERSLDWHLAPRPEQHRQAVLKQCAQVSGSKGLGTTQAQRGIPLS